jgi:hypothetical protein
LIVRVYASSEQAQAQKRHPAGNLGSKFSKIYLRSEAWEIGGLMDAGLPILLGADKGLHALLTPSTRVEDNRVCSNPSSSENAAAALQGEYTVCESTICVSQIEPVMLVCCSGRSFRRQGLYTHPSCAQSLPFVSFHTRPI